MNILRILEKAVIILTYGQYLDLLLHDRSQYLDWSFQSAKVTESSTVQGATYMMSRRANQIHHPLNFAKRRIFSPG